jgi:hypothetical protein
LALLLAKGFICFATDENTANVTEVYGFRICHSNYAGWQANAVTVRIATALRMPPPECKAPRAFLWSLWTSAQNAFSWVSGSVEVG